VLFAPFTRMHIADSTGFGLPENLKEQFRFCRNFSLDGDSAMLLASS